MTDPIVEEVRKARDEYAAQFNYDLQAMVANLREQQIRSGRKFVNYSKPKDQPPTSAVCAEQPLPQSTFGNIPPPQPDAAAK